MADDALFQFETLMSQIPDTEALIRATYESVNIITPWVKATSDNCALHPLMVTLYAEAKGFVGSVTKSYDNAQSGYEFAKEATNMCRSMLDDTYTNEDIQDLITKMRGIARRAHEEAKDTANSLCANRIGFNAVLASIPEACEPMNREHKQDKEKKDRVAQQTESWKNTINRFCNGRKRIPARGLIVMPYVAFTKSRWPPLEGKEQGPETKLITFEDMTKSLQDAEPRLTDLMDKMNNLAGYWLAMDAVLEHMHGRVKELDICSILRIKLKWLATDWSQVGLEYEAYRTELAKLRDLNPIIKAITQEESRKRPPLLSPSTLPILPQSDPLAGLADVESCKEIKEIIDGAFRSLQIIEPWREAKTDHPQLQLAIERIQAHSVVYFEAIDTSIKTAQDGYNLSTDAIELCGFLLDKDTDPADLKEYITEMQDKAKCAHEESTLTWSKFRDVRRGLIETTKAISKEAIASPKEGKNFVVRFVSRIVGEKRDIEIDKALEELNLVALDMKNLSDNVDKFTAWWAGMETVLAKTKQDSQGLKPGRNTLRVRQIQKKWTNIQEDYQQYKVEIIKLQDHYPSQITAT